MSVTQEPFHDLVRLRERMNRLFEQALSREPVVDPSPATGAWRPAVDIQETAERILLRADLPGVELGRIEIKIQNDTLVLRGNRPLEPGSPAESHHRIERPSGSFFRKFTLPHTVEQEAIQAKLRNGVLEVSLPKKMSKRSQEINVDIR